MIIVSHLLSFKLARAQGCVFVLRKVMIVAIEVSITRGVPETSPSSSPLVRDILQLFVLFIGIAHVLAGKS